MMINDLTFNCTCEACPEQYDVYDSDNERIAYIRLRHGFLTCECTICNKQLYAEDLSNLGINGIFGYKWRDRYLHKLAEIIVYHNNKERTFK